MMNPGVINDSRIYYILAVHFNDYIMKTLFKIVMTCAALFLCACTPQTADKELVLDIPEDSSVVLDANGEKRIIGFYSQFPWNASIVDGSAWLEVSPVSGEAGSRYIELKANANMTPDTLTGLVEIFSAGKSIKISVSQESAFEEQFSLSQTSFEVPAEGGRVEVTVRTNIEYKFDVLDSWIKEEKSKAMVEKTHVLVVSANKSKEERRGTVTFCANMMCIPVNIIQAGSEGGSGEGGSGEEGGGGSSGAGDGEWTTSEFVHRSLALRVTADWCGACPMMASAMELAKSEIPEKLELANLHDDGGLEFTASYYIRAPYNVTGYPTCIVDGRANAPNYSPYTFSANLIKNIVNETEEAYPTKSGIALNSTLEGSKLTVDLSLYIKQAAEYKVMMLLLEDGIYGYQNGGGNNYRHDHVVRLALTPTIGDSFTAESDNIVWTKTYTATVPSVCDLDNIKLLVYVLKPYGDQSRSENLSYVEYHTGVNTYVDNCRVVNVGTDAPLELKSE